MDIKKLLIINFLIILLTCFMCENSFALVENTDDTILVDNANKVVSKISYDEILEKAQKHSYDIKLADYDVLISQQMITKSKSEYLPKLYAQAGTEYNKNFNDDNMITSYVGDVYVNPYTRFQSLFGFTLAYNVFDFGVRRGKLDYAKEDVTLKKKITKEQEQELTLNITDIYSKVLLYKMQIDTNKKIYELAKQNYDMKQRLYKAKEISKTEVNDQLAELKKTEKKLFELKASLAETLNLLSFYTGDEYDIEHLTAENLKVVNINPYEFNDYTQTLVWDIHSSIINKKLEEVKVVKHTNFPKINLYSKYYLYNQDETNYAKSLGIKPSNITVGASINAPIFDGFQNLADIKKVKLELEKLHVERDKAIAEYKNKLGTMRTNLTYLNEQLSSDKQIIKELTEKNNSLKQLLNKRLISPVEFNQAKIDLYNEQIEYNNNLISKNAILYGIKIITTYEKD